MGSIKEDWEKSDPLSKTCSVVTGGAGIGFGAFFTLAGALVPGALLLGVGYMALRGCLKDGNPDNEQSETGTGAPHDSYKKYPLRGDHDDYDHFGMD